MKQTKGEHGFSLLEVTIALLVMTVIIGALLSLPMRLPNWERSAPAYDHVLCHRLCAGGGAEGGRGRLVGRWEIRGIKISG